MRSRLSTSYGRPPIMTLTAIRSSGHSILLSQSSLSLSLFVRASQKIATPLNHNHSRKKYTGATARVVPSTKSFKRFSYDALARPCIKRHRENLFEVVCERATSKSSEFPVEAGILARIRNVSRASRIGDGRQFSHLLFFFSSQNRAFLGQRMGDTSNLMFSSKDAHRAEQQ